MSSRLALRAACGGALCAVVALGGCGASEDHPPPYVKASGGTGSGGLSGTGGIADCEGPPEPDPSNLCGNEVVPVVQEKPNIYFVLDASGSMGLPMDEGSVSRFVASKSAIIDLLHDLGHRIRYGLAAYPTVRSAKESCNVGEQVFATEEGDPVQCVNKRVAGPVLTQFSTALSTVIPGGGTPTAATLEAVLPIVTKLEGETFVVLLTDGAPNCNAEAICVPSECQPNIEGLYFQDIACSDSFNCCDPDMIKDPLAPNGCVDRDETVAAVTALADAGVKTYVIGVPGSEFYADLLDQLAVAGGTARLGEERAYYPVSDSESLASVLKLIGTSVATSCDITLQHGTNVDPDTINVYFDAALVPSSADDGWTFDMPTITLHGDSCNKLLTGQVVQVQVVAGCPTVIK